ncbi:T9SS type A sorting domain-containing protein [candidate division KSB1 bacterium]|nr:T9SS type A sorting domain-containing protein [candidate division KSB1 bacterium]
MKRLLLFLMVLALLAGTHARSQNCSRTSVGFTPLTELGAGIYQNFSGGFYPQGSNFPPAAHLAAGLSLAAQILPRNSAGTVDTLNGKIVLLSIGMSNTTQEFSVFKSFADADAAKNPKLVIVDGAQGGQSAAIISDSTANFWSVIDQRLRNASVTRPQVQVAWVKEADARPTQAFPAHAQILASELESIARILKAKYPNLKIAYWSSRIYAGYATTTLNPEPFAYESGFAVKWLIEKQINGDTSLTYGGAKPKAPWLAWGPYLWADGMTPRQDGLIWECRDFQNDGTHPAPAGRTKVANLLLGFFKTEATAASWFLGKNTTRVDTRSDEAPRRFKLEQNFPNPFNPSTTIRFSLPQGEHVTLQVFDVNGREVATLVDGEIAAGEHAVTFAPQATASSLYIYKITAGKFSQTRKAVLMK